MVVFPKTCLQISDKTEGAPQIFLDLSQQDKTCKTMQTGFQNTTSLIQKLLNPSKVSIKRTEETERWNNPGSIWKSTTNFLPSELSDKNTYLGLGYLLCSDLPFRRSLSILKGRLKSTNKLVIHLLL